MAAYGGDRRDGGPNSGQAAMLQAELEKRFMDPTTPRNELAWWAYHEIKRLREALSQAEALIVETNEVCRSTGSIADRAGRDTNWPAFHKRIEALLKLQFDYMKRRVLGSFAARASMDTMQAEANKLAFNLFSGVGQKTSPLRAGNWSDWGMSVEGSSAQLRIGKLIEEAAELGKAGERHLSIVLNDDARVGYFWQVTLTSNGYVATTSAKSLEAALVELIAKVKAARKTPAQELAEKINAQFKDAPPIRKVLERGVSGDHLCWIVFEWSEQLFVVYEGEKPRQEIVPNVPGRFVNVA